jgi:hypothetical protein
MSQSSPESTRTRATWDHIAEAQAKRPWLVLLVVALVTVGLGWFGARLTVTTGFEHMLPDGRDSVLELNRVAQRTAGVSTMFVVMEAPDGSSRDTMREVSTKLTTELRALGDPWVGRADNGVHESIQFFERHGGLYVDLATLEGLSKEIDAYYEYQVQKEMGTLLDEDEPAPKPPLDEAGLRERFGANREIVDRFPGGFFESKDGRTHVIVIRSKILGGDVDRGSVAIDKVKGVVEQMNVAATVPGVQIGYAGDLYTGIAEVKAIHADVKEVGILGAILIGGIILLYYLRMRTLFLTMGAVVVGLIWTAGVAYLTVEKLNTGTAFVFTIIAGNGVNTAIMYLARYLETRRGQASVVAAIAISHRETFMATLCAAVAAAASFFSLQLTDFRGYRELGLIGGIGLLLCWFVTLLGLPSVLALLERMTPLTKPATGVLGRIRAVSEQSFGRPFAFLVERAALPVFVLGIGVSVAGFVSVFASSREPFEFDMTKLRIDQSSRSEDIRRAHVAVEITGHVSANGMAILVDDPSQVAPLRNALYERRDAAPPELKPFEKIVALEDFIPRDQAPKVPILLSIRKKIEKARGRKAISDEDWEKIARYLPPADLKPIGLADLPEGVASTFTENDGTRGRIVYIVPSGSTDDARYLLRWAEAYRSTPLPDGKRVIGSGRAVIYADMWAAVMSSVPVALIASFLAVAAVVLVTFRFRAAGVLVLATLLLGLGWMALCVVLLDIKLNFLNFVALPITFGIGVDYAVNVVWRATREKTHRALTAVRETGGAVVLASLTTTLGYLALLGSKNLAVRSLGLTAVVGELCALVPAILVLPALLHWLEMRSATTASAEPA